MPRRVAGRTVGKGRSGGGAYIYNTDVVKGRHGVMGGVR